MLHYGLTSADLCDPDRSSRLFVNCGRDMEIALATTSRDGTKIAEPVEAATLGTIRHNQIDVVIIDPFVSSHRVPENDNGDIDLVAKRWASIANSSGAAVELVHHVRKLTGAEAAIEEARGGSALMAAARSGRALSRMTKPEAARFRRRGYWA
ncbi:AAA family ATPase [Xanthobacter sp. YC-JY1]|uniref:AAA family ATPase n=1 Tax=Xanthobacter sp. YC-JY1 TaxID=2419844 RepID=UPI001F28797E|nr:AAA family ATPase [Xanthobacter sp. YC-JY1]UJX47315.1 hypothetical protein D7006_23180 [Xanthobacter sp. YC-JY1]